VSRPAHGEYRAEVTNTSTASSFWTDVIHAHFPISPYFSCRYRARLNEILAAMKNPYLEIQELANNVVSPLCRLLASCLRYLNVSHLFV